MSEKQILVISQRTSNNFLVRVVVLDDLPKYDFENRNERFAKVLSKVKNRLIKE